MTERLDQLKAFIKKVADSDAAEHQAKGIATDPVGTSGNPSQQILTPANVITFCRLLLTIAFLVIFCSGGNRYVALACYAVAACTDFLDGQVARRTRTVSWLGKIMDPVMDRVLLFTGVLGLLVAGELPLWVPIFVIGRDVYLAIGASILQKYRTRPVDVVFIGKVTTALLMFGFCLCLLGVPDVAGAGIVGVSWLPGLNNQSGCLGIFFVYAGVVCSAITAAIYTAQGIKVRGEAVKREGR
ncbi:CDP-alcohol phosphatidyltransferase family protein [Paratractidigestivibacter sp.]|uniref:CDP-alcohol phosphatidyltransferase family protein n=1 Tax=Paratractidigestivibacter sp. TaxID=2847316 RepID=UPI002ABD898B|nr:CDP-alcohol phosphatidyltransferase family protein [Paratractidigestivibacter sp.]